MREAFVSATIEIKKKKASANRILSSGIGDSDGFPVFDCGTCKIDMYSTPDDPRWGFRITGGAEFKMPITVFQVTECGGLAEKGGIKLGDIVLQINGVDTSHLTLAQAHEIINSADTNLHLITKNMDEEELTGKITVEKSVYLRKPIPPKEIQSPRDHPTPSMLERKVWHPVMWQTPPPPPEEENKWQELPHHRIIRNIKRFFKETEEKPDLRKKHVEDILLVLPGASKSV